MTQFATLRLIVFLTQATSTVAPGPLVGLSITLPAAVLIVGGLFMYWRRLRGRRVPRSRRRIRRANAIVQVALTAALVNALSIADAHQDPTAFAVAWVGVALLLMLMVAFAAADSINTLRLRRAAREHSDE